MREPPRLLLACVLAGGLALLLACGSGGSHASVAHGGGESPPLDTDSVLQPASELQSDCFGWPSVPFGPENRASAFSGFHAGQAAVDFTLETPDGAQVALQELLLHRPVVLIGCAFTCTIYRRGLAYVNDLARQPFDETRTYGDVVYFVHVYLIEPHPLAPDVSPYRGVVSEDEYSTIHQPRTYEERALAAAELEELIEGNQILVVDELGPEGPVNPFWCTYGTAPNMAYVIRQDGVIELAQAWATVPGLKEAIDALLAR